MNSSKAAKENCAALAFHKSLIGLSQLNALERVAGQGGFMYGARGIYTYYVVYHLFCSCMLITPPEIVNIKFEEPEEVTDEQIDSPSEAPAQWDKGRDYEADWATKILHKQIKKFCKEVRKIDRQNWEAIAPYLVPLYKYFVDDTNSEEQCIPAMYEKLCYIRDRIIYRPSDVITTSGRNVQTSAQMGKEVRSLPGSARLYQIIGEIYSKILSCMEQERKTGEYGPCMQMLDEMWRGRVEENINDLCELGHKKRRLQILGQREGEDRYSYQTYVSHMLEIESIDFIRIYRKEYWLPLEKQYQESWKTWRGAH
ncbi:MAG TPA: hypothetical protein DCY31_07825 [Ruminococcaceae bacterium]|nr:hypothetical protein [Oscillospiraceae bacterium]